MLKEKTGAVVTIEPGSKVRDAVRLLSERRIGAVVVSADGNSVDGILSERDIVHALNDGGAELLDRPVDTLMTRTVKTCTPDMHLTGVMAMMTQGRFRHLPVVESGRLIGIISIGDAVKTRLAELEMESSQLRDYIAGAA
jgi:CBS domain-containing protein